MNLLQNRIKKFSDDCLTVDGFRKVQYDKIPYFMEMSIDYLNNQRDDYLDFVDAKIEDIISYKGVYNSQLQSVDLMINNKIDNVVKQFTRLIIPKLVDENFFYINNNCYVPAVYAIDYPIIIKNESIKLTSTFNSISIFDKDNITNFTSIDISTYDFFQLFLDMSDPYELKLFTDYCSRKKIKPEIRSEKNILNWYERHFYTDPNDRKLVIKDLERIFFDDYSRHLYKICYPDIKELSLKTVIIKAMEMLLSGNSPNFIDLKTKRLVFTEMLFTPFFKSITGLVKDIRAGRKYDLLRIDQMKLIKYFTTSPDEGKKRKGLSGNHLYNFANLYSAIMQFKINMVQPGIEQPPKEVRGVHASHFGKICPITVSSQNPGEVVSVIPTTRIDEYGRFI